MKEISRLDAGEETRSVFGVGGFWFVYKKELKVIRGLEKGNRDFKCRGMNGVGWVAHFNFCLLIPVFFTYNCFRDKSEITTTTAFPWGAIVTSSLSNYV